MAALVNHETWDVADAATDYLVAITRIIEEDQLEVAETAFRKIATPRFAGLGDAMDSGSQLLHKRMQRFLIVVAKDPYMREPLARQAAARIGLDGDPDMSAAPSSQLETILTVGVQDLGEPFFELLLKETIASEDAAFRRAASGALARAEDPALVRKLQAAMLAGNFKGIEVARMVNRQIGRKATTDLTFNWLRDNDEQFFTLMPEAFRTRYVSTYGGNFCSSEKAAEWQVFIESHADEMPGYERELALATEKNHLCSALRQSSAAELVSTFANYR